MASTESTASTPRSKAPYWAAALLLAAVFLYFSLRGIEWHRVWLTLTGARLSFVAAACGLVSVALLLRAIRWRVLLRAAAPVDIPSAFWATSAGYFGNNFLPARAGEVVRSVMISSRWGISKTFVLTTALSERICDAIVLIVITSVVLVSLKVRPGGFQHAGIVFAAIGFCGILCIVLLPPLEKVWHSVLTKLPLPERFREKIRGILEHILMGIRTFHDAKRLGAFVALTAVIWCCDAGGTVLGMRSLGMNISVPVAFLLITGIGLGSALPSTPGYVGVYQIVAVSVLAPFGFSKDDAIAYSFLAQAVQYVTLTFWGLLALTRQRSSGIKIPTTAEDQPDLSPQTYTRP
jgi:glycosyltransferase 2 family protein